jgi:hypothetical protein
MSAKPSDSNDSRFSSERLLNVAKPALSAELTKMLDEFRGSLDAEANVRLKKALLDKEAEIQTLLRDKEAQFESRLADELKRVDGKTTDKVTQQLTSDFEMRFNETLSQETDRLTERFSGEAETAEAKWKGERAGLVEARDRWQTLAEYHRKIGEASSQLEILRRFLRTGVKFANSAAVYLNKEDGLALWNAEGEAGVFPDVVSEGTIDPEWYFSTVVVRGKVIAAITAAGASDRDALVVMADTLKRAIENFGLRLRFLAGAEPVSPPPVVKDKPAQASPPAEGADPRGLARTLVSEIKLGHEKQVLEGRVNADLYTRLEKQIEEARASYQQQLSAPTDVDYFHEEILKILADNILSRLGEAYPGPR